MPDTSSQALLLDSWPVIEWLKNKQPVAAAFTKLFEKVEKGSLSFCMSRINYGEVIYIIRKERGWSKEKIEEALEIFRRLPITRLSVSDRLIDVAVELKSVYNISYADAFAAAQSMELALPLVTGDKELLPLQADGLLQLHWLGA